MFQLPYPCSGTSWRPKGGILTTKTSWMSLFGGVFGVARPWKMSLTWHRSWMPRQGNLHDKSLKMITNCLVEVLTKVLLVKYGHSSFYPTKPLTMKKKSGICGSFGCVPTLRYGAGAKKTACLEVYRNGCQAEWKVDAFSPFGMRRMRKKLAVSLRSKVLTFSRQFWISRCRSAFGSLEKQKVGHEDI